MRKKEEEEIQRAQVIAESMQNEQKQNKKIILQKIIYQQT